MSKFLSKINVEKPNVNGCKININYEGKFTLKFLMTIYVENPNVNDRKIKINYKGKFKCNDENIGDFNEENRIDFH